MNPNLLILVEGIECYKNIWSWWPDNLFPEKDHPIKLSILVFSSQKWFYAGFRYDTLAEAVYAPLQLKHGADPHRRVRQRRRNLDEGDCPGYHQIWPQSDLLVSKPEHQLYDCYRCPMVDRFVQNSL
jgi:hypothetical protein